MKSRYKTRSLILMWFFVMLITFTIHSNFFAQVSVEMTSGITTEIQDVIRIDVMGDWLNNGSMIPGSSLLLLNGSVDQVIKQTGGGFYNVTIDKSIGEVSLESNIAFQGGILSLLQKDLSLNGHVITLDAFASLSETEGNTVKGYEGYITTMRNVVAPSGNNIAGMGLMIASNGNYGSTEIRRGHAAQIANGAESILRYFEVNPEFNEGFEATVVFLYDESELNGNLESGLTLFHSPDGGMNWINVPGILNTTTNSFEATGINPEGRFTLSSHCLETCIATQTLTTSIDLYLNGSGLAYLHPEDVDNNSTGACGIDTMFVFPEVFDCSHAGVQEVLFTIIDNNGCSKTSATTITVIDT